MLFFLTSRCVCILWRFTGENLWGLFNGVERIHDIHTIEDLPKGIVSTGRPSFNSEKSSLAKYWNSSRHISYFHDSPCQHLFIQNKDFGKRLSVYDGYVSKWRGPPPEIYRDMIYFFVGSFREEFFQGGRRKESWWITLQKSDIDTNNCNFERELLAGSSQLVSG